MGQEVAFLLPITAIVFGIGAGIVKTILTSQERRLELRLQAQQSQDTAVALQEASLRAEIAELRNTSTEFSLSLDTAVQRLERRVEQLETKPHYAAPSQSSEQHVVQNILS